MFFCDFSNSLRFSLENALSSLRISESLFFAKKAAVAFRFQQEFLFLFLNRFFSFFSDFSDFSDFSVSDFSVFFVLLLLDSFSQYL